MFQERAAKDPPFESVTADQGGNQETIAHINNGKKVTFDFRYIDEKLLPVFFKTGHSGRTFQKASHQTLPKR